MARPRTEFPPAGEIRALADPAGRLALHVTPGARSESVAIGGGKLAVKVRAKPTDGAANEAVLRLLADALGVAPSALTLLRGATSREKLVQLPPA
jgi:uncharacterized protein YggU (UPF0235/DUF167 family)